MQEMEGPAVEWDARGYNEEAGYRYDDLERFATASGAVALLAYGFSRRTVPGMLMAAAAVPLAYRALAGHWPQGFDLGRANGNTQVALSGARGVHVRESVRLEKPVGEVYGFWRRFENLPRFMMNLERVTDLGSGRSHWEARGPGDVRVEWDAEIIKDVPDRLISWRSLPGADVVTAGSVCFEPVRNGRETQIAVHLQYEPPAGRMGSAVAWLAGREPSQSVREDLRRLKQCMEAGEIARTPTVQTGAWER
ncbi:MAG: SRPBCC family protein [Vicinamibacterales bacterium]